MQPQIFAHLFIMAALVASAWVLMKGPWVKKPSINIACEKCYYVLMTRILAVQSAQDVRNLENDVDDFYNEFAGKALKAEQYKDYLYALLSKVKYA
jgi:hypothetical protein